MSKIKSKVKWARLSEHNEKSQLKWAKLSLDASAAHAAKSNDKCTDKCPDKCPDNETIGKMQWFELPGAPPNHTSFT